ncbi:MAG: hypothetical protein Q8O87_03845 [bacterium]|nr:hypothetical protein [bacterium]
MYNFILQTTVILALGIVVFLVARVKSRVGVAPDTNERKDYVDNIMTKLPLAKIDNTLNSFFGKSLRKFKVVVMKVDNLTNIYINKLKKNGNVNPGGDIKEVLNEIPKSDNIDKQV